MYLGPNVPLIVSEYLLNFWKVNCGQNPSRRMEPKPASDSKLKRKTVLHSQLQNTVYSCTIEGCSKSFKTQSSLNRHERSSC